MGDNTVQEILKLFVSDSTIYEIIFLSIRVSLTAVFLGMLVSIPLGTLLGMSQFRGQKVVNTIIYTLMSLPPVLAGLLIYLLLSTHGPLGKWQLLFSPTAMVIAQFTLVTPIIIGLTMSAVKNTSGSFRDTIQSLGATPFQKAWLIIREARAGILTAVLTSFGRAVSEVGAVMLVGGNIEHFTRVMTTSIVLETRKGDFTLALGLGVVLLLISFVINGLVLAGAPRLLQRSEN